MFEKVFDNHFLEWYSCSIEKENAGLDHSLQTVLAHLKNKRVPRNNYTNSSQNGLEFENIEKPLCPNLLYTDSKSVSIKF